MASPPLINRVRSQMANDPPPLLGDGTGRYRILVIGNSGTGKSTLSTTLAKELKISHISLDVLNFDPGWREASRDEFRARLQEALQQNSQGWVVDGNYIHKVGTILEDSATDIIWVDPPLLLYFPRVFIRTLRRLIYGEDLCSPGCGETVKSVFFSKDSILWWCLTNHPTMRRRGWEMMSRFAIGSGSDITRRRMRRIDGWGGELKAWWRGVEGLKSGKQI